MAIIDPYTQLRGTGALDANPVNYTPLSTFTSAPKYTNAFSQAHNIGTEYPSNISATSKYDKQGLSSDVRHTLGSAAGKEAIIDWASANLGIDPYGKFANVIGNVGITSATALHEIPDAWRSFKQALGEKDYGAITSGNVFAQPWEDVRANLNAWDIPYGASLEEKKAAVLPTETSIDPTDKNLFTQHGYEEDDEYDFSGIEGQTAMIGLPQLFGMISKGGITKKAIQKALIQNQISGQIGKRVRPHLVKTLRQKLLGEKFGGSGKFKNISTSNKNYGPYTQPTSKPTYTPPARPHGGGGARPNKPGGFTDPGKGSYGPHMAYGGRVSYFDGGLASLWPR